MIKKTNNCFISNAGETNHVQRSQCPGIVSASSAEPVRLASPRVGNESQVCAVSDSLLSFGGGGDRDVVVPDRGLGLCGGPDDQWANSGRFFGCRDHDIRSFPDWLSA